MAAPRRQFARAESPVAGRLSESDLLELLPEAWRPLVQPLHRYIVGAVAAGVLLARALDKPRGNEPSNLRVNAAAADLQVSPSMIRNLVAQGELEATRIKRCLRITKASLEAFKERNKQGHARE